MDNQKRISFRIVLTGLALIACAACLFIVKVSLFETQLPQMQPCNFVIRLNRLITPRKRWHGTSKKFKFFNEYNAKFRASIWIHFFELLLITGSHAQKLLLDLLSRGRV